MQAGVAVLMLLSAACVGFADSFEVNNAADTATAGTLRAALNAAQGTPGGDTITFTLAPGTIISIGSQLPDVGDKVVIDGNSVILNGSGTSGVESGLVLSGSSSVVHNLQIWQFAGDGILVTGDSNQITACKIGNDGTTIYGNAIAGVEIDGGANNIIGGPDAADGNVISGNTTEAIYIHGATATGTIIENNKLNVSEDGLSSLTVSYGPTVKVQGVASTEIGRPGAGNQIMGNNSAIELTAIPSPGAVVQANLIGRSSFALLDSFWSGRGIFISSGTDVLIGGPNSGEGNTLNGFRNTGIYVTGTSTGVRIQGNTLNGGISSIPYVLDPSNGIEVDNSEVLIGGTLPGAPNTITDFAVAGIYIGEGTSPVTIRRNSIYGNGAEGIQLGLGANGLLPHVDVDVDFSTGATTVIADTNGTVDLFADDFEEGQTLLASLTSFTNTYTTTLDPAAILGKRVTAIFTTDTGRSTAFSEPAGKPLDRGLSEYFQETSDLEGSALRFTPAGPDDYTVCKTFSGYETMFAGGTPIVFTVSNEYYDYTFQNGFTFSFFGQTYNTVRITSRGNLTLGGGNSNYLWDPNEFHTARRIAGLFGWLEPNVSGTVTLREQPNRLTVQYADVPSFAGGGDKNSVQIDLYNTGEIILSFGRIELDRYAVGLSSITSRAPADFVPARFLSSSPSCLATSCDTPCYVSCAGTPAMQDVYGEVQTVYAASGIDPFFIDLDADGIPEATNAQLLDAILDDSDLPVHCCVVETYENNLEIVAPYVTTHVDDFIAYLNLQPGTDATSIARFVAGFATWGSRGARLFVFSVIADVLGDPFPEVDASAIRYAGGFGDADGDGVCNSGEYRAWVTLANDAGQLDSFLDAVTDSERIDDGGGCYACLADAPMRDPALHAADVNGDYRISLSELLRVIQLFNRGGYYCADSVPG
jgi:hypothetical protein